MFKGVYKPRISLEVLLSHTKKLSHIDLLTWVSINDLKHRLCGYGIVLCWVVYLAFVICHSFLVSLTDYSGLICRI